MIDLTELKQIISGNHFLKKLAEPILNFHVKLRYCIKKQYTKDGADKEAFTLLSGRFGMNPSRIRYFDIGANHYLRGNNTYLFYRHGAKGVLVEADPLLCQNLQKKRENDCILSVAICDKHESAKGGQSLNFYVCSLPTRSTLDPEQAKRLVEMGFKIERVVQIPSMTFDEIVEKTGIIPDYLSIDVEGYDFRVLKSIDFEKYPIKVIIAEYDKDGTLDGEGMIEYMERQGYKLYQQYVENVLFIRNI